MKAVILCSLSLLLTFASPIRASNNNSRPVCPTVYAGSDGAFELFWFCPNFHRQHLGNIDESADTEGCVGMGAEKYGVLTRFGVNPPVVVDSVKIFISDSDPFPNLPGDQYSPIMLSLKRRKPGNSFSDIWVRGVALDSSTSSGGSIVSAPARMSLSRDFELWAGCEWLKSHPTAPQV
ncbi:MAG: hypothetical protein JSU69_06420, partial [Candidatus Zixiibacteriota bacterium]